MKNQYLFQLGAMSSLCWAELQAVFPSAVLVQPHLALLESSDNLDAQATIAKLGGTVKIAQVLKQLPSSSTKEEIIAAASFLLQKDSHQKIYFALGELGRDHLEPLDSISIKEQLLEQGFKVRFAPTKRQGAGAGLLLHKKLREILVISTPERILLAQTVGVQDIDEWSRRDRGKPYANHKKGMLPPKLGRQMLNLARLPQAARIWDPFSGTGTILLEAMLMDNIATIYGSDLDSQAVSGSQQNLTWLVETSAPLLPQPFATWHCFLSNATTTTLAQLDGKKIDAIVSEPFLGKQTPREGDLANIFRGLEKLYWGCFRNWRTLLIAGAKVVLVFPKARDQRGREYHLNGLLDKLQTIGYTKCSRDLEYARPNALIRREICVFSFKG